ncbi:MAG: hypothetical protein WAV05_06070 [Anaerolineales bacterium]
MIVSINYFLPNAAQPGQSDGYPPPGQANSNPVPTEIPYPGPYWILPTPEPTATSYWPTTGPGAIDAKTGATLSPSQIAEIATYDYERQRSIAQPIIPTPTLPFVQISSLADLPQAIYDLPIYADDACIQARNPGQILPVKSLMTEYPDYYMIPFYENDKPCKVLVVIINDGQATIYSELPFLDKVFPSVSAEEAVKYVTDKTGLQVSEQPILVFGRFRETSTTQENPCWQVKTTDGQVYYVFFFPGIYDDSQQVTTIIQIFSQEELHPLQ